MVVDAADVGLTRVEAPETQTFADGDAPIPPSQAPVTVPRRTAEPPAEDAPSSERTVFGTFMPSVQHQTFTEHAAARRQLVDVRAFAGADDEHTALSLGVAAEPSAAPSARRPPTPPSRIAAAAPPPRRPAGLRAADPFAPFTPFASGASSASSAADAAKPNPFLPPPSKFFQQPTGPGRSKPRESTLAEPAPPSAASFAGDITYDIDPDDLPPPSSRPPESEPSSAPPPLRAGPSAPSAATPQGMPPPPPRAPGTLPKAVVAYRDEVPFDLELEARLLERQDWPRLVDLYASSAMRDDAVRVEHLVQAASILHEHLAEFERAFFTYLDALVLAPELPEAAIGIERAAHELGVHAKAKWSEAARRLKKVSDQTGDPDTRAAYLALLFRWNNQELRRRDIAAEVFARLAELAPGHPTVLERKAN